MYKQNQVLLGARIPANLKEQLLKYCLSHGIKMNYFVSQAIKEKLVEIVEDYRDEATAQKRLKNAHFVSQQELNKYLASRRAKV